MSQPWPMVPLGEIIKPLTRTEPVCADKEYRLLGVRLDGAGPFLRETKLGSQISATMLSKVKSGDFIYSRLFAWRGAFGIIGPELDGCYVSNEFPLFQADSERLDLRFLRLWFCLPTTLNAVESDCTGSTPLTRNRFKEEFFFTLKASLPPLAEQRQIVARIEELAAKVEDARRLRKTTQREIKIFNEQVHDIVWDLANKTASPSPLEECADVLDPQPDHRTPPAVPKGLPYVSIANINLQGRVDFSAARKVPVEAIEKQEAAFRLQTGDIVLGKIGTIGAARSLQVTGRFALSANIVLVQPRRDQILPEFLLALLRSPQVAQQFSGGTRTTAQSAFGIKKMRKLLIPVPSANEQREIMNFLTEIENNLNNLQALHTQTAIELDALMPSILDKAFKGEL